MRLTILAFALILGGCALVKNHDNPVTTADMYRVEQTAVAIVSGLNTYKAACIRKLVGSNCRVVIVQIQSFTRPAAATLVNLRRFFKENDQINAINAYNTLVQLMADARSVALANGVTVP